MIDSRKILENFEGEAPIFPLPNFVMFPKTAYSFNIFEERYKALFSDIISSDKLFCMSLLKEHKKKEYNLSPEFYSVGTLCYIIEHNKLENGNYNIIASGIKKVRITEKKSEFLYRSAQINFINESICLFVKIIRRNFTGYFIICSCCHFKSICRTTIIMSKCRTR